MMVEDVVFLMDHSKRCQMWSGSTYMHTGGGPSHVIISFSVHSIMAQVKVRCDIVEVFGAGTVVRVETVGSDSEVLNLIAESKPMGVGEHSLKGHSPRYHKGSFMLALST